MKAWTKAGRGSAPGSPSDGGRRPQEMGHGGRRWFVERREGEDAGREAAIMELGGTWARTAGPGKEGEREGIFRGPVDGGCAGEVPRFSRWRGTAGEKLRRHAMKNLEKKEKVEREMWCLVCLVFDKEKINFYEPMAFNLNQMCVNFFYFFQITWTQSIALFSMPSKSLVIWSWFNGEEQRHGSMWRSPWAWTTVWPLENCLLCSESKH